MRILKTPPLELVLYHDVSTVILNDQNETLLFLRDDLPLWTNIGGNLDPGEDFETALHREVMEETGLQIELTRLVGDFFAVTENGNYRQERVFLSRPRPGSVTRQSEEGVMIRWFPVNALPANIGPRFRTRINAALDCAAEPVSHIVTGLNMAAYMKTVKDFTDFVGLNEWKHHPNVVHKRKNGLLKFDLPAEQL